jgi:cysteine-rich repeat protein
MKVHSFKKFLLGLALTLALGSGLFGVRIVQAQSLVATQDNLDTVSTTAGLGNQDLRIIIARLIRGALGVLGIIVLVLFLYGGFLWMTAGGDDEKVARAKKLLVNTVIGLVIIMFSMAITQFILQSLMTATGSGNGNGDNGGGGGVGGGLGGGNSGIFQVTRQTPTGTVSIRNVVPQITFSQQLDGSTVTADNLTFTYADGTPIAGALVTTGNRVSFTPATPCPAPNETRFCFNENAQVNVEISTDVKSIDGTILTCLNELCTSSFTTGAEIDTEDPVASLELPDDGAGVPSDALATVQVRATDDAQVAVADFLASDVMFDSVPAAGDDLTDVLIETVWDTAGLTNGTRYRLTATVSDIAGNTDSDSVTVQIRSASCFDGVMNGTETGPDCGGDPVGLDYCGACAGSSCTDAGECASGFCEVGICVALPVINSVTPPSGAPGTWVTLAGSHFGLADGTVTFSGVSGPIVADFAPCADAWSDTQIIVTVPDAAIDGPITITTATGKVETTFDTNGPLLPDFDVNSIARPGLCSLSSVRGAPNDATTLSGTGFGGSRDGSQVLFGSAEAGSYSAWSQTSAAVTIPSVPDGLYDVTVKVGGVESNNLKFLVETDTLIAPAVVGITPNQGGIGQYVTISGTSFGNATGTVWFEDKTTGERLLADTNFPAACGVNYWSDQELTVIVPDGLDITDYNVIVVAGAQESNPVNFTVTDDSPSPGLCTLDPDVGAANETITVYGDNFGMDSGKVIFSSAVEATIEDWTDSEIIVSVPSGAVTGSVVVESAALERSNPVNFEVSGEGLVVAAAKQAAYAWSFSSGDIPSVPQMIFECSESRLSGVPNNQFDNGVGVCVNASVFVEFTMPMNEPTLRNLALSECTGGGSNPCSETAVVSGSWNTTSLTVEFIPTSPLKSATTYFVDVPETVLSADGVALANSGGWSFTTRADSSSCTLEKVIVSPSAAIVREQYATQDFTAKPTLGCTVLSSSGYTWDWSTDPSYARINTTIDPTCKGGNTNCAVAQALAEGVTPVTATETVSGLNDNGALTIDFRDPYITNYWPNCTEACTNAEIGASFNTSMSVPSIETAGRVQLYTCANELCTTLTTMVGPRAVCTLNDLGACTGFRLTGTTLLPGKYYRVIVSGEVTSLSSVPLTRTNYGGDYSWTFRVREDGTLCAVERISVTPESVVVDRIGAQQTYMTSAYGVADSCSVSGQRLSGYDYNWAWTNPIADQDIDRDPATHAAAWISSGAVDTNVTDVPQGCTTACTAAGSLPQTAVCGDGRVGLGEECEDGNVANGDGCSASCLREGSTLSTCGDGTIQQSATGAGEDCDDGNTLDGDGCSAMCLAEGSSSVGATCGNNDVAVLSPASQAGEECDDGNASNGDGCSRECLREGAPTLSEIGGAVCGNGGPAESPAEECDDGNILDGDGCSSQCLWEGASNVYGSTCGLNGLEYGEACDDGNDLSGDGCSSMCLREGSSSAYLLAPSFCGDGQVGTGELAVCEVGVTGDGKIDPLQVAFIPDEAALEVDPGTQKATATIEVKESSSGFTTQADLSLMCVAENDSMCPDPVVYGVGKNNCCILRPEATFPINGENICRNGAIYAIFTSKMDVDDFTYTTNEGGSEVTKSRMYARLDLTTTTDGLCPADHTTLAQRQTNFLAKLWRSLAQLFKGRQAQADTGDCVLPIQSFTQVAQSDGTYKVQMHAAALMQPNADYELVVEGDDDLLDNLVTGVRTALGVGLNATRRQTFTTAAELCALDAVQVTDTNSSSPNVFTQGDEQHDFTATAVSYATGIPQEIASLPGIYSWDWTNWSANQTQIISVEQDVSVSESAQVTALGENGNDVVMATATIKDNTAGVLSESEITGSSAIVAFLCENPWPGSFSDLPWSDTADGDMGAELGGGWMNFSTLYCRDAGEQGTVGDLPDLAVVRPPVTESANVIKEYFFEVSGSPDAIGIRVASNANYLSPQAWYASQGFTGSPSSTEVDGYPAIKDGRTTYVVAPNQTVDGDLYPNIYVISYNEGASADTQKIYEQILNNFRFAVNISDVPVCDTDAPECDSSSDKLRRDVRRLIDMTDLADMVNEYVDNNGVVPALPSGTFVRALSSSAWDSWDGMLGGALGENTLPTDPINAYRSCGESGFEGYEASTCVNQTLGTYVCPLNSHAYHYRSVGTTSAWLYADLEYTTGSWVNDIDQAGDNTVITVSNTSSTGIGFDSDAFCDGATVWGSSTACGDDVVGSDEVCELGQIGGTTVACTTTDGLAGTRSQICNASCSAFVDDAAAVCVVASCGDGVIDPGEDCDDGSFNGKYGFCGNACTYDTAFYCGDGQLAGGEVCDCGATALMSTPDSRAFGSGPGSCVGNVNGVYASSPNASCAWNCSGPAAYCGDGTIDSGEVCDGSNQTWSGRLCSVSSAAAERNQPCTTDSECSGGTCGDSTTVRSDCPFGTTRVMTCDDAVGASCTYVNSDWSTIACTDIGSCGDGVVDPDEVCDDGNTDGTDGCTDECKVNVCGDGRVYVGSEQCDEGLENGQGCNSAYGSSCTACSLSCRYEVSSGSYCGDGEINGSEYCDANSMPPVSGECTGGFADAGAACTTNSQCLSGLCLNPPWGICNGGDDNGSACTVDSQCDAGECVLPVCSATCMNACPVTYASEALKMTTNQPGAKPFDSASLYSFVDSATSVIPNTATLTIPACRVATGLTASISMDNVDLPTTYVVFVTDLSYTMRLGIGGSVKSRLDIAKDAIAEAVGTLYDEFGEDMQIGAVGYRGLTVDECFNDATISCSTSTDCETVGGDCNDETSAYDEISGIVMTPFGYVTDFVGPDQEAKLLNEIGDYTYDTVAPKDDIDGDDLGHGTFTYEALAQAKNMFDEIANSEAGDNARYIAILLSDGQVNVNTKRESGVVSPNPIEIAQDFDAYIPGTAGYELYAATLADNLTWIKNMKFWSGNSYDGLEDSYASNSCTSFVRGRAVPGICPKEVSDFNGIDYAYDGANETEMTTMYEQIVDSITSLVISLVAKDPTKIGDSAFVTTVGSIHSGSSISLPWPEGFVCDPDAEQQIPVQINFPGKGQIEISNVRLDYCAP